MVSETSSRVDDSVSVIGDENGNGKATDRKRISPSVDRVSGNAPELMDELSLQELLEARCFYCESCEKRFWLECQSHICGDGLRVIHTAPRGVQVVAERYEPGADLNAGVLTRSDVYRGSYHRPNDLCSDIPACFSESPDEWTAVSRRRARAIGRVPCSVCVCEGSAPSRRSLLLEAREWEDAHPFVVKR